MTAGGRGQLGRNRAAGHDSRRSFTPAAAEVKQNAAGVAAFNQLPGRRTIDRRAARIASAGKWRDPSVFPGKSPAAHIMEGRLARPDVEGSSMMRIAAILLLLL